MGYRLSFAIAIALLIVAGCNKSTTPLEIKDSAVGTGSSSATTDPPAEGMVKCDTCGMEMPKDKFQVIDGKNVCEHCVKAIEEGKKPVGTPEAGTPKPSTAPPVGTSSQSGSAFTTPPSDPPTNQGDLATCAACGGTLAKADAVSYKGETLCQACEAEKKRGG